MKQDFDIDFAEKNGVKKAVIYHNITKWLKANKAENINIYEGYHWADNSIGAFCLQHPYMNLKEIKRHLKEMRDSGLIMHRKLRKKDWYTTPDFRVT